MRILKITDQKTQRERILVQILKELSYSSVETFQRAEGLEDDGLFGPNSYNKLYQIYLKPENYNFEGHYSRTQLNKNQIVLHHSAGWDNARGMFDWWKKDGVQHVATAIGITDNGNVIRGYDESFWAFHIGLGVQSLEQKSIAVEICNWGCLEQKQGKLLSWTGAEVPSNKVIELNYKGYKFYEVYTEAEIETTRRWILLNALRFDIPLSYNPTDFWQVSQKALRGVSGLYTHNSYISWKTDISPQPKMIEMLEKFNAL